MPVFCLQNTLYFLKTTLFLTASAALCYVPDLALISAAHRVDYAHPGWGVLVLFSYFTPTMAYSIAFPLAWVGLNGNLREGIVQLFRKAMTNGKEAVHSLRNSCLMRHGSSQVVPIE